MFRLCRLQHRKRLVLALLAVPILVLVAGVARGKAGEADTGGAPMQPQRIAGKQRGGRKSQQEEYVDRRGIRVIVGHYVGDEGPSGPNYTKSELNENRYNPVKGAGERGLPVLLKSHQQILSKRLWNLNQFNIMVSDMISVDRNLSDVRSDDCKALQYLTSSLPRTSVIIVFHNEAWSTLIRTVHSVINTSPKELIREIILVDDASEREYLGEKLETELKSLPVESFVIRSKERVGLIQARLLGAKSAKGAVLTFLDAHCECTKGWLEPLLYRIRESPESVVCPVIDIINDESFQYTKSFSLHWGGFNWELHFRWYTMGARHITQMRENSTRPYGTPVMAGGLFSINTEYFWSSGSYDEKMDIWGGENLEMSFRVWQCGGRIEIAPCSRVGHVFRRASPYTFPREGGVGAVLHGNLARLAMTWMDDYSRFYFKVNPQAKVASSRQNVEQRRKLRDKCKSFDWYLDTVWPENFLPRPGQFFGKLRNEESGQCIQKPHRKPGSHSSQPSGPAQLEHCVENFFPGQLFTLSRDGYLMGDESVCLDSPQWKEPDAGVRFMPCAEQPRQKWQFRDRESNLSLSWPDVQASVSVVHIVQELSQLCLTAPSFGTSDPLILQACSHSPNQDWHLQFFTW